MSEFIDLIRSDPNSASAYAAVLAVIVSLGAVFFTVLSLWMQRIHNFRSLQPIPVVSYPDYEDDVALRLFNAGVGPMIIERVEYTKGGTCLGTDITKILPEIPQSIRWNTFFAEPEGWAIVPGENITLVQLAGDFSDPDFIEARDRLRRTLAELTVTVSSRDIYKNRMKRVSKSLVWYGRHYE